jgi:hypothetical protein
MIVKKIFREVKKGLSGNAGREKLADKGDREAVVRAGHRPNTETMEHFECIP